MTIGFIPEGISTNSDVIVGDNATVNEGECSLDGDVINLCIDGESHQRLYVTYDVDVLKKLMTVAGRLIIEYDSAHAAGQPMPLPE